MIYVIKSLDDLARLITGEERSFVNNEGFFDIVNRTLLDQLEPRPPIYRERQVKKHLDTRYVTSTLALVLKTKDKASDPEL